LKNNNKKNQRGYEVTNISVLGEWMTVLGEWNLDIGLPVVKWRVSGEDLRICFQATVHMAYVPICI